MTPQALLEAAGKSSHYARRLIHQPPAGFDPEALLQPLGAEQIAAALANRVPADVAELDRVVRQLRNAGALHVLARDVGGVASLDEVLSTMTALAEQCIGFALLHHDRWLRETHGEPLGERSAEPQQLMVVAMGKLGGGELNVSSDIDLVFVYPEEGETQGPRRLSNHEYFCLLGRRLIASLGSLTADGMAYRVDMRLRPWGESGPLAVGLDMLEAYLLTQGRDWERYAWLKARALTGNRRAALEDLVTPFVYRRYLDYALVDSLRQLHAQIRLEVTRRDHLGDVKLGPGGIREVEFLAQIFQLVRGGADTGLRLRGTREALRCLGERRLLPGEAVAGLLIAYAFLRKLEHCLQYVDDQQTQMLPGGASEQAMVAAGMGFDGDYPGLLLQLEAHRGVVTRQFETIFAGTEAAGSPDALDALWQGRVEPGQALEMLQALGFAEPAPVLQRLQDLRSGSAYRRMTATTQERFDRLLPGALRASASQPAGATSFERLLLVLESIGRRDAYLALLLEFPAALERLARIAATSAWASRFLATHPLMLDELIAPRLEEPDAAALVAELSPLLERADGNQERQMDLLREFKQVQTVRLLTRDLDGGLTLERVSDHLSALADTILGQTLRLCWASLSRRHRESPAFAVIGYGKLGGKELGYASDLDIIFLHDDLDPEAPANYARLAQRMNTWMNSHTGAGLLYQTDLRLRPDGASGLLVSSLEAFSAYQRERAWPWEHQALTRARFACGDPDVGAAFEALRTEVLRSARDREQLRAQVVAMRAKMAQAHVAPAGRFDLKHGPGGMVDVEFLVQYLVLAHACEHASLVANSGNIALLGEAARLGLVKGEAARSAQDSYRALRARAHRLLLDGEDGTVDADSTRALTAPVIALWRQILG